MHVLTTLSAFNSALRLLKSPSIWRRENETDRLENDGQTEREKMHQRLKISVWKKKDEKTDRMKGNLYFEERCLKTGPDHPI